jgi:hypothetical protein
LFPWLRVFGKVVCHGKSKQWNKTAYFMFRKQKIRGRGKGQVPTSPSRANPQRPKDLSLGPTSSRFYHLPAVPLRGLSFEYTGLQGPFKIQTLSLDPLSNAKNVFGSGSVSLG